MKPWRLGSIGERNAPLTVMAVGDNLYGLGAIAEQAKVSVPDDRATVLEILRAWDEWLPRLEELAEAAVGQRPLDLSAVSWLPPIVFPGKLVCVGANYRDHLDEMGVNIEQSRPFVFFKPATTSLVGHGGRISAPKQVRWLDWEGELGVVMGRTLRDGRGADVFDAVAGYTSINDISARDWANELLPGLGQDWFMHKAFDDFTPVGPTITPKRFIPNPQSLDVALTVNGEVKQASNTSRMIFSIVQILEHLSSIMTLEPGDIVATGTPAGVGFGRRPPESLAPGDSVVVRIEGLGELHNIVGPRGERFQLPPSRARPIGSALGSPPHFEPVARPPHRSDQNKSGR
jgi:2-keto-4-pentenoate hydratase/2-oxohepta-3-ene-1,7-dioic acid hydratase in catechol pathway